MNVSQDSGIVRAAGIPVLRTAFVMSLVFYTGCLYWNFPLFVDVHSISLPLSPLLRVNVITNLTANLIAHSLVFAQFVLVILVALFSGAQLSTRRTVISVHAAILSLLIISVITGSIWSKYAWGTHWSWDPSEGMWVVFTFVCTCSLVFHLRITSSKKLSIVLLATQMAISPLALFAAIKATLIPLHTY